MQMQEAFSKFAVEDVVKRKILRRLRSPRLPLLMGLGPQAVITCHCQPMVSCIRIIPIVLKPFFIERQIRNIVDIVSKKRILLISPVFVVRHTTNKIIVEIKKRH